jgi:UDP-glucose 4-epimerase
MRTILVTGRAGFVGSHACKALARVGYGPVTFDNVERDHEWAVKSGSLERGDLRDGERVCTELSRPGNLGPSCISRRMPTLANRTSTR